MEISEIRNLGPADLEWLKNGGRGEMPVMTRSQFMALKPSDRMVLAKAGFIPQKDPEPQQVELPPNGLRRADFDRMSAAERHAASRNRTLVD